jgi:hypothetical protein
MTRFHFTFDSPSDDDAYPEKELVYSDDDDDDENDAPEHSRGNVKRSSRYALECCDIEFVDCSLVAYTQYPPLIPEEARSPIVLPGRNAETASIPALCQLSFCSPRYDTPLRSSGSTQLTLRDNEEDIPSYDQDMLRIAQLLREIPPISTPRRSAPRAWRPATNDDDTSRQALRQLREQLQQQHAEAQQALQKLLQREADQAVRIQKAEQEVLRRRTAEREAIEQEAAEKEEAEREATLQREQEDRLKAQEQEVARAQESAAAESPSPPRSRRSSTEGKSPARKSSHERIDDHAARAFKLRAQLVDVQQSVAEFETSPRVKDRRLAYKKLVNGRINTLAENVPKIRHVAQEVEQAIATARQADEANKTPSSSKNDVTILGKRYLVNLLASKVMVRAQAEGFNGYVLFLYCALLNDLVRGFH